ncbi:MAG: Iron sulfur flavoprotein [Methanothrix harundinacea]|uniref:Iron sulfur flavoprotein n=1 Tax=Methanothrix harundinacea TaxID=301375 RepID=A0A117LFI4_9EURY|nr:MAG: Iron sulfur flavoprotein [Methanothrix harundinacea]KUK94948.1 MAG: Iron sulfur flavoprotein [Methanothrix harundinacea]
MKILAINASPRGSKSQTLRLVKAVFDGAKESGAEMELVVNAGLKLSNYGGIKLSIYR